MSDLIKSIKEMNESGLADDFEKWIQAQPEKYKLTPEMIENREKWLKILGQTHAETNPASE